MGRAPGNRDEWWGARKDRSAAQLPDPAVRRGGGGSAITADPAEPDIPFDPVVVAEEERLLVADKPPFLASTPNGRLQRATVQQRLRESRGEPELVSLHRLDRLTSGLILVSRDPATRGAYQRMFEEGGVAKRYEALTAAPDDWAPGETREIAVDIANVPGERGVRVREPGAAADPLPDGVTWREAVTDVTYVGLVPADVGDVLGHSHPAACTCGACGTVMSVAKWSLRPRTGRTHQLRATMHHLGSPILGDDTYPCDLGLSLDDVTRALRLVAVELFYDDPVDGMPRHWRSARRVEDPRATQGA
ncbi:pseudouridine synthase [Corynebacterium sp.]|uniref:pseudouridine synthase n=1 Tax=Corynebacterium sp. TaxID=1720 RepID=UPI0026DAE4EB|nr:pseudouridine synthase [Corynebacterium sp.]MDO4610351.1 pseudouridine synthase [Corynebacterium sp.]